MTEPDSLDATRASYDTLAVDYAERFRDELAGKPLERAMLAAFAEAVRAGGGGDVVEAGSGPGGTTAHLRGLGLSVSGVDLSPGMVAVARRAHPELRFEVGSRRYYRHRPDMVAELLGAVGDPRAAVASLDAHAMQAVGRPAVVRSVRPVTLP